MESFRVQQGIEASKSITNLQNANQSQQAVIDGDFFAAFLQLLMQGSEDGQADVLSQLTNSDEDEDVNAMEMMAALLGNNPNLLMNENFFNAIKNSELIDNPQVLQQLMTTQNETVNQFPTQELNSILSNLDPKLLQDNKDFKSFTVESQGQNLGNTDEIQSQIIANSLNAKETSSSDMLFNGNMNFQSAINQAQKLIKGDAKASTDISEDGIIENLQQSGEDVKFETVLSDKQVLSQPTVDINDLALQVKNGISNGFMSDEKEFTVKLKPEGLGEVVVRMAESDNKLTVNIVTASNEVAKLLNNDLSTLRESMKAMQVDVRDVVVEHQTDFSSMQQDLQQQMFQGQSNHFGGKNQQGNSTSQFFSSNDKELYNVEATQLKNEGMDIYA